MKKVFGFGLIILFAATSVYAQSRGALTNVWASNVNVTTESTQGGQTISFPFNTRDLLIGNYSGQDICVDLKGNTTDPCGDNTNYSSFILDAGDEIYLTDFITNSIRLADLGTDASPISVVVTY